MGRRCFEDAVAAFERLGAPYQAARARKTLARCLAALGRPAEAAQETRKAAEALRALGAVKQDAGPSSPASRRARRKSFRLVARGLITRKLHRPWPQRAHGPSSLRQHSHETHLPSRSAAVAHAANWASSSRNAGVARWPERAILDI